MAYIMKGEMFGLDKCSVHTKIDKRKRHGSRPTKSTFKICKSADGNEYGTGHTQNITYIHCILN